MISKTQRVTVGSILNFFINKAHFITVPSIFESID